ncbi:hypothetical protein AB0H42_18030 [Nocardia sp. NPDC050799]|uniref:hypothetical protein n=1 Tax=Nocardia sp. NPDC050799 TaxID=3154842 RepID=UPI003402A8DA
MRNAVRGGILAAFLLAAPLATAAPSPALPLEQPGVTERENPAVAAGLVCTMQYPPTLPCFLASLSAA